MNTRLLATVAVAAAYLVGMASLALILAGTIALVNLSADGTKFRAEQSHNTRASVDDREAVTNSHLNELLAMK